MPTRRNVLRGGLAAIAWGLAARRGRASVPPDCVPTGAAPLDATDPFKRLPRQLTSITVDGISYAADFFGDDFANDSIPFHHNAGAVTPPPPQEDVDVAVVGGGISGLSAALLLRRYRPVVFDLRDRFGGNALGEVWRGSPYGLGSAYVITPDRGSFLARFYRALGLHRVVRVSEPPDPVALNGEIRDDFYSGAGLPPEERAAFDAYADVVTYMADERYPEIPLPRDPAEAAWIRDLDNKPLRQDIEERMGMPLPPLLAAAVQGYCLSSFGAGFDELSAASGWNFLAAEEYGRWVFPGGNTWMAHAMWKKLARLEHDRAAHGGPRGLRAGCRVVDVREEGERVLVTYIDAAGTLRSIRARHVVMAGSKHVCKYVVHDLQQRDPDKFNAMNEIRTAAYVVANVLLKSPLTRDFYDIFLLHADRAAAPAASRGLDQQPYVIDMLNGSFAQDGRPPRSVLTLYWPLSYPSARFRLIADGALQEFAALLSPQIRNMLDLLKMSASAVEQVRIARWGHAMPIAQVGLIASGVCDHLIRPFGRRIHFANQDNWALPAVENSLLESRRVADAIRSDPG